MKHVIGESRYDSLAHELPSLMLGSWCRFELTHYPALPGFHRKAAMVRTDDKGFRCMDLIRFSATTDP